MLEFLLLFLSAEMTHYDHIFGEQVNIVSQTEIHALLCDLFAKNIGSQIIFFPRKENAMAKVCLCNTPFMGHCLFAARFPCFRHHNIPSFIL
jgi:hypothetical protein